MRNQRQGVRSTKCKAPAPPTTQKFAAPIDNDIVVDVHDTNDTMFTDQTGKFPHLSRWGNRYQMVFYHVSSNSVCVEAMKNITEAEIIKARDRAVDRMKTYGIKPRWQIFDNEASAVYKEAVTTSGMTYQLVPPDDHRHNIAEKEIQTWKYHFIAVLSGTKTIFHYTYGAR